MIPLVGQLSGRHLSDAVTTTSVLDLRSVEMVPAAAGLVEHTGEVAVQRGHRVPASEESFELRMVPIAPRLALKHRAGKQALAPESDEPS
jgi:hypothetical protein